MANIELQKVAKYICSLHSEIALDKYKEQLIMIYGAIGEPKLSKIDVFHEVIEIEKERIESEGKGVDSRISRAVNLCLEYSKIAFSLAQKSLKTEKSYAIVQILHIVFDGLIDLGIINKHDREESQGLISETHLDFEFAKGNHNVSSLKMAQIIRDNKRNGGN